MPKGMLEVELPSSPTMEMPAMLIAPSDSGVLCGEHIEDFAALASKPPPLVMCTAGAAGSEHGRGEGER